MKPPAFNPLWDDETIRAYLLGEGGYIAARKLPDGTWATAARLLYMVGLYMVGLCLGVDECGWRTRYCFDDPAVALFEFSKLESIHDEPVGYIAMRGERVL